MTVMDSRPLASVSVVIPCFRCTRTIARAVESVAAQSQQPLELILVDDGSNDDTVIELRRLQTRFGAGWVRLILLESNAGPATARNAGWTVARGDFVAFLDADDTWHPRKLEIQSAFMRQRDDVVLTGHRSMLITPNSSPPELKSQLSFRKISLAQMLLTNHFITPSAMLRRDTLLRFTEGKRHMEDHLLWMQIAAAGFNVIKLDAVLAFTYKPAYGETGLSAQLWAMEKAELNNYLDLRRQNYLGTISAFALCSYSLLKFLKRLIVIAGRRLAKPFRSTQAL